MSEKQDSEGNVEAALRLKRREGEKMAIKNLLLNILRGYLLYSTTEVKIYYQNEYMSSSPFTTSKKMKKTTAVGGGAAAAAF